MAESEQRLGDLVKKLAAAKKVKDATAAKHAVAENAYKEIEQEIILQMKADGTTIARNAGLTVSLSESVVPQVTDWEALGAFILRHKRLDLFQRRLSVTAYDEIVEAKKLKHLPGCSSFTKLGLRVTVLKEK